MKKMIFAGCLMAGASVFAQAGETDSLKVVNLQEVQIVSTRATSKTPVAFTNVSKEELKKQSDSDNDNNEIYLIEKYQRKYFYDKYNNDER